MFGSSRRRAFDRQNEDQNSTGYSEKTVFSTDFGAPQNTYQNGMYGQSDYAQSAPQNNAMNAPYTGNTLTETAQEKPMVFASREHSDIYIYEYSDRLEYYLKTATSMYRFNTVKKQ